MNYNNDDLYRINGGVKLYTGGETVLDFGFRSSTPEEIDGILYKGADDDDRIDLKGDTVILTDYLHALSLNPLFNWQLTGSCVNGGGQNALMVRMAVEIALLPQAESFCIPFTLFAYGQSRADMGWRTEGDGSTGSSFAKNLNTTGVLRTDNPKLPKYHNCSPALVYDRDVELKFSSVRNHPNDLRQDAKKYNCKFIRVNNSKEAIEHIRKGRPLTWAGDWGGLTNVPMDRGYRLNKHSTKWNHQQSTLGFTLKSPFGLLFLIQNQWFYPSNECKVEIVNRSISKILTPGKALSVHGSMEGSEIPNLPEGSYWIQEKDMDYQCRTGEVFALFDVSGFDGPVTPTA